MKNLFNWLHKEEGWKAMMALIYAIICIFDFIIVPIWIGSTRRDIDIISPGFTSLDVSIQLQFVKSVWAQHEPFTLMGGGMFHIAFGALLTGSAVTKKAESKTTTDTSSTSSGRY